MAVKALHIGIPFDEFSHPKPLNNIHMFKNLLLVAIRNFKRDKGYSLLNILGLMIGITFSLFLIFYIKDELSYDRYNEHAERLYRLTSYIKEPEKDTMKIAITQLPL